MELNFDLKPSGSGPFGTGSLIRFLKKRIRILVSQKDQIRPDPAPQHWFDDDHDHDPDLDGPAVSEEGDDEYEGAQRHQHVGALLDHPWLRELLNR